MYFKSIQEALRENVHNIEEMVLINKEAFITFGLHLRSFMIYWWIYFAKLQWGEL